MSPNTRLKMCISPQSRSHLNPTQALRFTFLLCLSWILPQSGSWYLHLTYIQVTSRLHPGPPNSILIPSKHHLKPIQVTRCVSHFYLVSQLHPSPISPYPRLKMGSSTQSKSHLNPIQVSGFVFPLHPGSHIYVSSLSQLNVISIWLMIFSSRLHPGNISPSPRSTKLHLGSI